MQTYTNIYTSEDLLNQAPEKFIAHKMLKLSNYVKPKIGMSDVACMTINWVRISYSCLKVNF